MPVLEVSLPLDLLLSSSSWAWLIALFVATIATFSRFSLFSFFMIHNPISRLVSFRHFKLHHQLVMEENSPSESASMSNEALSVEQEGLEKGNPRSFLHQEWAAGEENEAAGDGNESEEDKGVPPSWISSLVEASRTSTPALEAPRACTSCVPARSWSQSLHRKISTRVGMPWDYIETRVGMPLHYQVGLPCLAECLCNPKVSKVWSCQQLQMLQLLHLHTVPSTISALEMGTHNGFTHVGYRGGEVALWDVEKRFCLSRLSTRISPVTALFVAPSYPRVAIEAGTHTLNQTSSVVSVWDDRCASHSANFILSTPTSLTTALGCRAHEFGIAGERYVSMYDLRMLRGNPIFLYSSQALEKAAWGGQGNNERGAYFKENEANKAHEVEEEADECVVMDKMSLPSTNHLESNHASSKRRCCFIINCLSFMCCLVQNPNSL